MKKRLYFLFSIFVVLGCLQLTACGQKGPLYLPDEEPQEEAE